MREHIILKCEEDGRSVYHTNKNKKNTTEKLRLKKYNRWLKRHTYHAESKK